jgi:hypothetical protein
MAYNVLRVRLAIPRLFEKQINMSKPAADPVTYDPGTAREAALHHWHKPSNNVGSQQKSNSKVVQLKGTLKKNK